MLLDTDHAYSTIDVGPPSDSNEVFRRNYLNSLDPYLLLLSRIGYTISRVLIGPVMCVLRCVLSRAATY